jgi:hypothetical protein
MYACLGWSWKDQMKRRDRGPLNRGSSARKLASEEAIRCLHLQHCHYCAIMQMCPCKKCEYFLYPHLQLAWCCPWPIFCFEGYRTEPKGASGKTRQIWHLSWNLDLHTRESGNKRIKPPIPSFQIPVSLFLFHSLQIDILYSVILRINNLVLFDIWMVLND